MSEEVPKALSVWFVIHFIVDMFVAVPLFFFPERSLELLGWETIDPLLTRVAAAAFFAIEIESLIGRRASLDGFGNMLNLKLIWSLAAVIGIGWALLSGAQGAPLTGWLVLATFVIFHFVWLYWRLRVRSLRRERAAGSRNSPGDG